MERRKTVAILVVSLVILVSAIYSYYSLTPKLSNVDLVKTMSTNEAVEVSVTRPEYYPEMSGYLVVPSIPGKIPAVVMIHEWWGLNDNIKEMAQLLAKEGYVVLAVDLYKGKVATTSQEAGQLVAGVQPAEAVKNMRAAVSYLKKLENVNPLKIAGLGWCFGGGQSLRLALSGEQLAATVLYYGTPLETDPQKLSAIKWPVLGIFGDQDRAIPVDRVKAFELALQQIGVRAEIHVYPGVGHAFANPSGQSYAPNEAMDAWQKTLVFLAANLKQ